MLSELGASPVKAAGARPIIDIIPGDSVLVWRNGKAM